MDILKKLKKGSGNFLVMEYLLTGGELTVASAREIGLTNDLRSRISDLRNRYGVEGIESMTIEGETGAKYKKFWFSGKKQQNQDSVLRIKVSNGKGDWLVGKYDRKKEIVYYDDGREQRLEAMKFDKHLGGIIERI